MSAAPRALALMYHRICPRRPDTAAYFARGTAVEPETFAAQLRWITARYRVTTPRAWLTARPAEPVVMLTVDDGYRDVVEHAAPICAALGAPLTVFPIAGHLGAAPPTWVDAWYGVLHRARRRADLDRVPLAPPGARPPALDADLRWWVRGPIKARLHALAPPERRAALAALADALDAPPAAADTALYCTAAELAALAAAGHEIGGHGLHHERLTACAPADRDAELRGAWALLDALDAPAPRTLCYPDGAHDAAVAAAAARVGFAAAFTVEPGAIDPGTDPLRWPRHIVRDRPPSDPGWCRAFAPEERP